MLKNSYCTLKPKLFPQQKWILPRNKYILNNLLCISEVSPLISCLLKLSSWGYLWNHNKTMQVCLVLVPPWPVCLAGCHVWPCCAGARSSQSTALDFTAAGSAEDRQLQGLKFSWVWTAAQHELHQGALCLSLFWKLCNCLNTIIPLMCENENCSHIV